MEPLQSYLLWMATKEHAEDLERRLEHRRRIAEAREARARGTAASSDNARRLLAWVRSLRSPRDGATVTSSLATE